MPLRRRLSLDRHRDHPQEAISIAARHSYCRSGGKSESKARPCPNARSPQLETGERHLVPRTFSEVAARKICRGRSLCRAHSAEKQGKGGDGILDVSVTPTWADNVRIPCGELTKEGICWRLTDTSSTIIRSFLIMFSSSIRNGSSGITTSNHTTVSVCFAASAFPRLRKKAMSICAVLGIPGVQVRHGPSTLN